LAYWLAASPAGIAICLDLTVALILAAVTVTAAQWKLIPGLDRLLCRSANDAEIFRWPALSML
jgi:hypothetical protein